MSMPGLINFGYVVSDTFEADSSQVNGFMFGTWEFPGDVMLTVDWSITSGENGGTIVRLGHGERHGPSHFQQPISATILT